MSAQSLFWLAVLAAAACCAADGGEGQLALNLIDMEVPFAMKVEGLPPQLPVTLVESTKPYQDVKPSSLQDWTLNGDMIISRRNKGDLVPQLHLIDQKHLDSQSNSKQLTNDTDAPSGVHSRPKRNQFVYSRDIGGSENYQLYHFDLDSGKQTRLTDGAAKHGSATWSTSGDWLAFTGTGRNGKDEDIYLVSQNEDGSWDEPKRLQEMEGSWGIFGWSPSDEKLLLSKHVSIQESYLYVLQLPQPPAWEHKELEQIHPTGSPTKCHYTQAIFGKNSDSLFYTSDDGSEFHQLWYLDMSDGSNKLLSADIHWDVTLLQLSKDRNTLAFATNEDGISKLYLLDTASHKYLPPPSLPPMAQLHKLQWHPSAATLALMVNNVATPGDVLTWRVGDGNQNLVAWTHTDLNGLDTSKFVTPKLIKYTSFDGLSIPAFVYKSSRENTAARPVLIHVHGGPEGQSVPSFLPNYQHLIQHLNLVVIDPNVRGSTGYGKTYTSLDIGYNRENSVKDIGALLDWIKTQPDLDSNRVAIWGGSYGGYMVLASLVHFNDRLRCGVDMVGISNFLTFLNNTKDYRRDLRRVKYGDERDPAMASFLQSISPLTNAHKIKRPLMIAQGKNDPRVPVGEAVQMKEAVQANGQTVWYLEAANEGHGFSKKNNRDFYMNYLAMFLQKFLVADEDTHPTEWTQKGNK